MAEVDVKEALAALGRIDTQSLDGRLPNSDEVHLIRAVLQSVAQERQDLSAVNTWLDADDERYQSSGRQYGNGYYLTLYPNQMRDERHPFYGATRAEAVSNAATWCRAEMAK